MTSSRGDGINLDVEIQLSLLLMGLGSQISIKEWTETATMPYQGLTLPAVALPKLFLRVAAWDPDFRRQPWHSILQLH